MNLLDCILDPDMGGGWYSFERTTETVTVAGLPEYDRVRSRFEGNIQPAPGRERELLEEEDRLKGAIVIYSPVELTAGDGAVKADRVFYRGHAFRVSMAEPWPEHAGYTKALAVLEMPGAAGSADRPSPETGDDL